MADKLVLSKEEKKMLNKAYRYSLSTFMAFNQVVMQGQSFGMTVWPAIDMYYKDPEEKREAFARNANEFFNTHQVAQGLIGGIIIAMEKERAEKGQLEATAISGLKAALMGPLAGIFDSFFFNCVRVIIAGICIGLAADGSIIAPILFLVLYGGSLLVTKYILLVQGYRYGVSLVNMAFERGIVPLIMEACGVLGAVMIGTLIASNVSISIALTPEINGATFAVQDILDGIMPGLLSLVLWWVCFKGIQKGITPVKLIFLIMGACVVLALFGVF